MSGLALSAVAYKLAFKLIWNQCFSYLYSLPQSTDVVLSIRRHLMLVCKIKWKPLRSCVKTGEFKGSRLGRNTLPLAHIVSHLPGASVAQLKTGEQGEYSGDRRQWGTSISRVCASTLKFKKGPNFQGSNPGSNHLLVIWLRASYLTSQLYHPSARRTWYSSTYLTGLLWTTCLLAVPLPETCFPDTWMLSSLISFRPLWKFHLLN